MSVSLAVVQLAVISRLIIHICGNSLPSYFRKHVGFHAKCSFLSDSGQNWNLLTTVTEIIQDEIPLKYVRLFWICYILMDRQKKAIFIDAPHTFK